MDILTIRLEEGDGTDDHIGTSDVYSWNFGNDFMWSDFMLPSENISEAEEKSVGQNKRIENMRRKNALKRQVTL